MARMISRQEAAKLLDITEQSVSNWVNRGLLTGHMMGRVLMVDMKSITSHFDSLAEIAAMERNIDEYRKEIQETEQKMFSEVRELSSGKVLLDYHGAPCLLKSVVGAIMEVARDSVLTEREYAILNEAIEYGDLDILTKSHGLSRARILQICHGAINKIACMGNYAQLRQEKRRLENENKFLASGVKSLQTRVDELERDLQINNNKSLAESYEEDPGSLTSLLNTRIVDLNLTVRSLNILRREGIETLSELVTLHKTDLLKFRDLGKKSLAELDDLLDSMNLSFGMDVNTAIKEDMRRFIELKTRQEDCA